MIPDRGGTGSFPCQHCGHAKTCVVDGRRPRTGENMFRRRRVCPKCGYRMSSVEVPVPEATPTKTLLPWLQEIPGPKGYYAEIKPAAVVPSTAWDNLPKDAFR